jgi:putative pyruvate formate lyase activating enzyme
MQSEAAEPPVRQPDPEPAYLALYRRGDLEARAAEAVSALESCDLCPRNCGIDRRGHEGTYCSTGRQARVTSAFAHHGEETCLSGRAGSGTIFFGSCSLRCVFCQNADISQEHAGAEVPPAKLATLMLELQRAGCHNINFVSPSHVVAQVLEALVLAAQGGLRLPLVYNSGGYDCPQALALLDGVVDIYMPDFKLWSPARAARYLGAQDYPERARSALREMHRQVGPLVLGSDSLARRGLLVRHLVLPGLADESAAILAFLARDLSPDTYVNIMAQYRPSHRVGTPGLDGDVEYAEIARRPTRDELVAAYDAARRAGLWRFDAPSP